MKVAIIHYWLVGMMGGEKVLESLCKLFPEADIFTHVVDYDILSPILREHNIKTTFIASLPFARVLYQRYLPLMPMALKRLDLSDYTLVISSESGPATGVVTSPDACHICYCHTPMRYLWSHSDEYEKNMDVFTRIASRLIFPYLRKWDKKSASLVDFYIANSTEVGERIKKYFGRDSTVIHPPVDTDTFEPSEVRGDFYLMCGRLVAYKRADLAIQAFNESGRKLIVIGGGEELSNLKRQIAPNVTLLGHQPD